MQDECTIKIAGEAGQGMQTIGAILMQLFKKTGRHVLVNQDYMSRIRGGNNFTQLRIAGTPLYSPRHNSDIVVALDMASMALHRQDMSADGVIILDKKKYAVAGEDKNWFDVPLYELAQKTGASDLFVNTVACGVVAGLTALEFGLLELVIKESFADKSPEIIETNIRAARAGYEFVGTSPRSNKYALRPGSAKGRLLMNANDAIALAAIRSGCKFYTAYPMTPSTSILNTVAHYAHTYNIVVEQAEDEIAAVNMAIGASFAGVRAMTGTSGGGFALMVEGVSLAGMTETPLVVAEVQRPAPATGFPTRTEQADLDFVIHAGHGEFARAVFSPGTIEEAYYLTRKAFDLAEKYQIPVFILSDQYLADTVRDIEPLSDTAGRVERHIISRVDSPAVRDYKRYLLTESGISPRAVPSWISDVIYADSDEHTEEGHITEDAATRTAMVDKRLHKKMAGLAQEIESPVTGHLDTATTVLLGFGSTYGVLRETCERLAGKKYGFVHLPQVWPFPAEVLTALLGTKKKIITVENNAAAQLARLLRRETGITCRNSILRYDGRPFDVDYLVARLTERKRP